LLWICGNQLSKRFKKKLPHAKIVFDLFFVVTQFNRVIDNELNSEYRKASEENKADFNGAKYLLLKSRKYIHLKTQREQLKQLLELKELINTTMIFKEPYKHIWSYRLRTWAGKAMKHCCDLTKLNK
jgi:transposase